MLSCNKSVLQVMEVRSNQLYQSGLDRPQFQTSSSKENTSVDAIVSEKPTQILCTIMEIRVAGKLTAFFVLLLNFAGVMETNKQGKLVPLLTEAGAIANNSSQL